MACRNSGAVHACVRVRVHTGAQYMQSKKAKRRRKTAAVGFVGHILRAGVVGEEGEAGGKKE